MIYSNLVKKERLREVQRETFNEVQEALINSFGPMGSNTEIYKENKLNQYTKDGHTILNNIQFYNVIERAIQRDLVDITQHIVKKVGDGTTSAILLSNKIFTELTELESKMKMPPYELIQKTKDAIKDISNEILSQKKEFDEETAYDIALISSNGNTDVADQIKDIYSRFGKDVFIDVGISNTTENMLKIYDGMTLEVGYSDTAYINDSKKGTCTLRNPSIFQFKDPIDTPEQMSFLSKIVEQNIMIPYSSEGVKKGKKPVPTVIMAPRISRDMSAFISGLVDSMYQIDDVNKPPLLIITNIYNEDQFNDITRMCGCKPIKKYVNLDQQKADIEQGIAPTLETLFKFAGSADIVESDVAKTKFVNPKLMFEEDGKTLSTTFNKLVEYLEAELKKAYEENEDAGVTGNLKRRINSLKANMVEILIGGVSASDRDSLKDLVEDTVLNCRSAARNGYGFAANFEGLRASYKFMDKSEIHKIIYNAYLELVLALYKTMDYKINKEDIEQMIKDGNPINIRTKKSDNKVVSSIQTDIVILDALSKILSLMITCNQFMTPSPVDNIYMTINENK